jgi:PAS domain S-box-containing protein/putative nucleotidyltransferase with HDIG domain
LRRWITLHPTVPAIVYFVVAVVWIAVSDRVALRLWPDPDAFGRVQTLKGWAFVAFSALLIASTSLRQQRLRQRLEREKQVAEERALGAYQVLLERLGALERDAPHEHDRGMGRALHAFLEELGPFDGLQVWRSDGARRFCVYAAIAGREGDPATIPPVPLGGDDLASRALAANEPVVGAIAPSTASLLGHRALPRSGAAVPVTVHGTALGVFEVWSARPDAFADQPPSALRMAVSLLGLAWHNHDLWRREEDTRRAIAASEARFKSLVQNSSDVVMVANADGAIHELSDSATRILGVGRRTPGGHMLDRVHPEDLATVRASLERVLDRGHDRAEWRVQHADGAWRWLDVLGVDLRADPNVRALVFTARDVTERKRDQDAMRAANAQIEALNAQLEERLEHISALHRIDRAITSGQDLRATLTVALDQVRRTLGVDAAAVLRFDSDGQRLEPIASHGFRTAASAITGIGVGEGVAGRVAELGERASVDGAARLLATFTRPHLIASEGFEAYDAVPLQAHGERFGVLEVFHRTPLARDANWATTFATLAEQVAIAIDNDEKDRALHATNRQLIEAYDATIEGWAAALDLRDEETQGHSRRVTELTVRLARRLGVGDAELEHVRRGALLHDIGKMGVPDAILSKPGKLDADEWAAMKRHPTLAHQLLSGTPFLREALDIPYGHHEKWDGSGYPRGLVGTAIPLAARIFAVVDVFDALTNDRPYREAWSRDQALAYVRGERGRHFDPAVADAFLEMMQGAGDVAEPTRSARRALP